MAIKYYREYEDDDGNVAGYEETNHIQQSYLPKAEDIIDRGYRGYSESDNFSVKKPRKRMSQTKSAVISIFVTIFIVMLLIVAHFVCRYVVFPLWVNDDTLDETLSEEIAENGDVVDEVKAINLTFKSYASAKTFANGEVIEVWAENDPLKIIIDTGTNQDCEITYEVDEIEGNEGNVLLKKDEGNVYKIVPIHLGTVRLIVTANGDASTAKAMTIAVKSPIFESISIMLADGSEAIGVQEVISSLRLYCCSNPVEALASLEWSSDDESVVKVSKGGLIQPVSQGMTTVRVVATSKIGDKKEQKITVNTKNALVKNSDVYADVANVNSDWIKRNVVIDKNAQVTDLGGGKYSVSSGERTVSVNVHAQSAGDWDFAADTNPTVYTNRGVIYLECLRHNSDDCYEESLACTYSLAGDTDALELDGNIILPKQFGIVNIIATAPNGETKTMEITVKECPLAFDLYLNKENTELGLAKTRVWGINFLKDNGELVQTYQFGSTVDESLTEMRWESSNAALSIDENRVLHITEAAAGKDITVTAYIMAGEVKTGVKRSFTFSFCDDKHSINIYNYEQLDMYRKSGNALVLQPDIDPDTGAVKDIIVKKEIRLASSVYGNGVAFDASNTEVMQRYTGIFRIGEEFINSALSELTLSNIRIYAANSLDGARERGVGIFIIGNTKPINIEFCRIYHCCYGIKTESVPAENKTISGDINIRGCYISYCDVCAINISSDPPIAESMTCTIENCVFAYFNGAAIFVLNKTMATPMYHNNCYPHIRFAGTIELYNWKSLRELNGILNVISEDGLQQLADNMGVTPQQIRSLATEVLRDVFERGDMQHLIYTTPSDEKQYISLGMLVLGSFVRADADTRTVVEDEGLILNKVKVPTFGGVGTVIGLFENGLKTYSDSVGIPADQRLTVKNNIYLLSYDFSDGEPRRKPNDGLPSNEDIQKILFGIL